MGSHGFANHISFKELKEWKKPTDLQAAYDFAVARAYEEYGNDPYNGSISTTSGVTIHDRQIRSLEEAYDLAEGDALDRYHKWEACGAIPVGSAPTGKARTVTRNFTIADPQDSYTIALSRIKELLLPSLKPGEVVLSAKVEDDVIKWKKTVTRAKGRGHRVYVVGMREFPTEKAAVDHVLAQKEGFVQGVTTITEKYVRDGNPTTVEVKPASRKFKVVAEVAKTTGTPVQTGWMFFGWAAC